MTGRQEYDRKKDRQRILGKYMIDLVTNSARFIASSILDISDSAHTSFSNFCNKLLQIALSMSKGAYFLKFNENCLTTVYETISSIISLINF
jgi:hypothetical protein